MKLSKFMTQADQEEKLKYADVQNLGNMMIVQVYEI